MESIITDITALSTPAEPLEFLDENGTNTEEGNAIIAKIKEVLESNPELLALSAPQIGINKRIFCLRFNDVIKTFINPIITKKQGLTFVVETCASLPGKEIVIARPEEITCVYYNDTFTYEDNKLLGVAASLFDQQAQLLDGVLPSELGLVSDIEADGKIEDADLETVIPFYRDTFLPTKLNSLVSAIESDEEANKAYKYLKFTESVVNGRTVVVESDEETKRKAKARRTANKSVAAMAQAEKHAQKASFRGYINKLSKKHH